MNLSVVAAFALMPSLAMACLMCDQKIALSEEQGACLLNNIDVYLAEAEFLDPVSINVLTCDGSLPEPDLDGTRTDKVVVGPEGSGQAELVSWYFLSAKQLRCLKTELVDATYEPNDRFEFAFETCPE